MDIIDIVELSNNDNHHKIEWNLNPNEITDNDDNYRNEIVRKIELTTDKTEEQMINLSNKNHSIIIIESESKKNIETNENSDDGNCYFDCSEEFPIESTENNRLSSGSSIFDLSAIECRGADWLHPSMNKSPRTTNSFDLDRHFSFANLRLGKFDNNNLGSILKLDPIVDFVPITNDNAFSSTPNEKKNRTFSVCSDNDINSRLSSIDIDNRLTNQTFPVVDGDRELSLAAVVDIEKRNSINLTRRLSGFVARADGKDKRSSIPDILPSKSQIDNPKSPPIINKSLMIKPKTQQINNNNTNGSANKTANINGTNRSSANAEPNSASNKTHTGNKLNKTFSQNEISKIVSNSETIGTNRSINSSNTNRISPNSEKNTTFNKAQPKRDSQKKPDNIQNSNVNGTNRSINTEKSMTVNKTQRNRDQKLPNSHSNNKIASSTDKTSENIPNSSVNGTNRLINTEKNTTANKIQPNRDEKVANSHQITRKVNQNSDTIPSSNVVVTNRLIGRPSAIPKTGVAAIRPSNFIQPPSAAVSAQPQPQSRLPSARGAINPPKSKPRPVSDPRQQLPSPSTTTDLNPPIVSDRPPIISPTGNLSPASNPLNRTFDRDEFLTLKSSFTISTSSNNNIDIDIDCPSEASSSGTVTLQSASTDSDNNNSNGREPMGIYQIARREEEDLKKHVVVHSALISKLKLPTRVAPRRIPLPRK